MNSCPLCHRAYEDEAMKFCLEDGTALQQATILTDPNATLVLPTPDRAAAAPTVAMARTPTSPDRPMATQAAYLPAESDYRTTPARKSPLPWILGIVVLLGVFGIVIALILARALMSQNDRTDQAGITTSSPSPAQSRPAQSPASDSVNSKDLPQAKPDSSPSRTQTVKPVVEATPYSTPPPRATPTIKATPAADADAGTKPKPTIAGGVLNGRAVHLVQPAYPPIARQAHASGTVIVQVVIDESGSVISAHAISGHPLLQAAAVSAARQSKFTPTKLSGQPVKVTGVIKYNFVSQ